MTNLAGLDLATTSGLACLKDGVVETTTFKANVKKNILDNAKQLDALREGEIGCRFQDFLKLWLIQNQIGYVAIEAPIPSNNTRRKRHINTEAGWAGQAVTFTEVAGTSLAAVFRIYGLEYVAVSMCWRLNIPCVFVTQGEWGKAFTGSGAPSGRKDRAVQQCKRLGIKISSVDAAEAVGILHWLDQKLNPYGARRANDLFAK